MTTTNSEAKPVNAFTESFSRPVYVGQYIDTPQDAHGRFFRATILHDDSMGSPWEEHDGHGPVREVRDRDEKRPGERVLYSDRNVTLLYDWQEATRIAKGNWGTRDGKRDRETSKQYAQRAVQEDFDFLRDYCNEEWFWVGVRVDLLQEVDDEEQIVLAEHLASLWGIESCNERDFLAEVANDLLEEARDSDAAKRVLARVDANNIN